MTTNSSPAPRAGRVLVVDDDDSVREALGRSLQLEGFDVVLATDGEEGLRILRADPTICIVLLDLKMRKVDGRMFRRTQRGDPRLVDVATIILTGSAPPRISVRFSRL